VRPGLRTGVSVRPTPAPGAWSLCGTLLCPGSRAGCRVFCSLAVFLVMIN
jgi:hypothetical protein